MKIFFLILKITGKKWTGEMVENGTGVNLDSLTKQLKYLPEGTGGYISTK